MVNLLFISNNSKIDSIKNALQPLLRVKIDSVGDFDFGLKDVFEKRPAMVFIQDQIAGVTGESVARHIQLLLGPGAPTFIFMHDGNPKAKPVKGLYEYLIDLSRDDKKVVADIQSALKMLLGPGWQKIYVPLKSKKSAIPATLAVPEEHHTVADQLVDEFISDLGNIGPATIYPSTDLAAPDVSPEEPFSFISTPHDQLAEIISENARELQDPEAAIALARDARTENIFSQSGPTVPAMGNGSPAMPPESPEPDVCDATVNTETPSAIPPDSVPVVPAAPTVQEYTAPIIPGVSGRLQSPPISPADFKFEKDSTAEEVAAEESLRAFEADYLSKAAARKWYQLVATVLVLLLVGGGWYLVKQKPHLMQSVVRESPPVIAPAPATQPAIPEPVVQKSVSTAQKPKTAVLPSFIPLAGHDRLFASQKPGWERYVGIDSEFRLFRSSGKLMAVQVLATKDHVISESRLQSILIELAGSGEYHVTSREQKHGFQVIRATVSRKADLLIYRKKSAVHAFVVSFTNGV